MRSSTSNHLPIFLIYVRYWNWLLRACNQLIPEGLKRAFEVSFQHGSSTYNIKIETEQTALMSQRIILGYDCVNDQGSNFVVVPLIIDYCSGLDLSFKDTIAHEFGNLATRNAFKQILIGFSKVTEFLWQPKASGIA